MDMLLKPILSLYDMVLVPILKPIFQLVELLMQPFEGPYTTVVMPFLRPFKPILQDHRLTILSGILLLGLFILVIRLVVVL